MAVYYDSQDKIFTLHTTNTTYQMKVDSYGYLLHLYYGAHSMGNMEYLLTYVDRGLSGNPYAVGMDRTYSWMPFPRNIPHWEPATTGRMHSILQMQKEWSAAI